VRSTVQGMSEVRPLFSLSEAIVFARCLGSSPWLFPIGLPYKDPYHFVRRQGLLEVIVVSATVPGCVFESSRNRVMATVEISWGGRGGTEGLTTKSAQSFDGEQAEFEEAVNTLIFGGGPAELPPDASISAVVKEKGIHVDEGEHNYLRRLGKGIVSGFKVAREAMKGHKTWGVPRASSKSVPLAEQLAQAGPDKDGFFILRLPLVVQEPDKNFVTLKVKWRDASALRMEWLGSHALVAAGQSTMVPVKHCRLPGVAYDACDLNQLLSMECPDVLRIMQRYYEADPLATFTATDDCPPIHRMVAVHGVNTKTEVMYALRLNTLRLKIGEVYNRFVLDDEAQLEARREPGNLCMAGGIVYEEPVGSRATGDGVVPLASLEHCRSWAKRVDVRVEQLPGVVHGPMLADETFHQVLRIALAEDRTPAHMGRVLLAGALAASSEPAPQKTRIWQAAKDDTKQVWWDFPPEVGAQLTTAYLAGAPSL